MAAIEILPLQSYLVKQIAEQIGIPASIDVKYKRDITKLEIPGLHSIDVMTADNNSYVCHPKSLDDFLRLIDASEGGIASGNNPIRGLSIEDICWIYKRQKIFEGVFKPDPIPRIGDVSVELQRSNLINITYSGAYNGDVITIDIEETYKTIDEIFKLRGELIKFIPKGINIVTSINITETL